ncbi:MAG: gephyrin-like molybdotransferase Glp [Pseudomonadota bacterium]|nr:gephyrin-like molybdotransferase Glp [Pseudomonadota bacterium]
MRTDLVPVPEALDMVLADAAPHGEETVSLGEAAFRVLSRDLAARRTQPPFAASAMDGYAVRASDVTETPVELSVIGQAAAGHPFTRRVGAGEAVRIFTGAPLPDGADTIVIQEDATASDDRVIVREAGRPGRHVRPAGLDFSRGDVLLRRGSVLAPQLLALAASMNHARVPVFSRPKVALIATGDELVSPGDTLGEGTIIASNTFGIAAIVKAAGGEVVDLGIVADNAEALATAFVKAMAAGARLIVTTGGASVGDHDLVKPVLLSLGARLAFEKLAMRPGKPMISARIERDGEIVRVLGLAGNPVSSLVASSVFLRPLVSLMAGLPAQRVRPVPAVLGCTVPANDVREDYVRATAIRRADGVIEVEPLPRQDSSMLSYLARADALLIRPVNAPPADKGAPCFAILLRDI